VELEGLQELITYGRLRNFNGLLYRSIWIRPCIQINWSLYV